MYKVIQELSIVEQMQYFNINQQQDDKAKVIQELFKVEENTNIKFLAQDKF